MFEDRNNPVYKLMADNKWTHVFSATFQIRFGVRQGSVLSLFLFAIYLDDIPILRSLLPRSFVVLYADEILSIAPSVSELQELFDAWLDMNINEKSLAVSALVHDGMWGAGALKHPTVILFHGSGNLDTLENI